MSDKDAAATALIDAISPELLAMRNWGALIESGGVTHWERVAAAEAKARALRNTREMWFATLERWEREWDARFSKRKPRRRDWDEIVYVRLEIKRLRHLLGIKRPFDEVRRQTRNRVRAFRERKRAQAAE